ncbi:MAG: N-6 DNA methylase [Kiritimatiellae bacterium]|nr:N-6 DNA methylase [Kiritimatiellia bacterium]
MREELIQRNLVGNPEKMGVWDFYNIGATNLRALKEASIIPNHDYGQFENKKPDALVIKGRDVIAAIEYKTPKELNSQRKIDTAIHEQIGTARVLGARVYIVTDCQRSFWINPATGNPILQEDGSQITLTFDKASRDCIALIDKIVASVTTINDRIKAATTVDPLPLATKVWQDLWAVSGATPENCLYTFVEIFIFKYLSDLHVLTGQHSFQSILALYGENAEDDVLEHYAKIVRPKIKSLFPAGPKDNTTIINGTIFVSKDEKAVEGYSTVFRKILNRFNDFGTLANIDRDFKSRLFETFLKESISKKNWGQYFTPLKVVRAIADMVEIKTGMTICDPACGVGKFLLEPLSRDIGRYFRADHGHLVPSVTLEGFDKGFDREEQKTIILAKANMLIYMADLLRDNPGLTRSFADIFNSVFVLQTNSILGTLAHPECDRYDLILTNPPYVMSGSSNLKEEIAKDVALKQHFAVNAMGIEGLFMEWIVRALKPGGKAFVVVPDGIFNRANDLKLRAFIREACVIDAVISLPINTFFTTNKKTYILALTKKTPTSVGGIATSPEQTSPVFAYLCSEIGESRDTYRFDISQNDLKDATAQFNMFKGAKTSFSPLSARCKIMPITAFAPEANWCVDRWWTKEEKVTLGIEREPNAVDISSFRSMLSDIASSIAEMDEMLAEAATFSADELSIKMFPLCELFDLKKGLARYTRKYGQEHKGQYPVYSASGSTPLTNIDSYDYDGRFLTWATNGLAGTILVLDGKFSLNGDRGLLLPKDGRRDIDLDYMKFTLEPIFRNLAKGRKGDRGEDEFTKLYPSMIEHVSVPVPMTEGGCLDMDAQRIIAAKYMLVEQCKRDFSDKCSALLSQRVV